GLVSEPQARQYDENQNADGDGVSGQRGGAEQTNYAHQTDPACVRDRKLQDAGQRNAHQSPQDVEFQANLLAQDADALGTTQQPVKLVEHTDAASGKRGQCRTRDTQLRKWSPAENQTGI